MDLRKRPVSAEYLRLPLSSYAHSEKPALASGVNSAPFLAGLLVAAALPRDIAMSVSLACGQVPMTRA